MPQWIFCQEPTESFYKKEENVDIYSVSFHLSGLLKFVCAQLYLNQPAFY